jgi:hypothetical protein
MLLRPEVLGIVGLAIASVASLAIWIHIPRGGVGPRSALCPHCGTIQHNLSRTAALAHELVGSDRCISCGQPLSPDRNRN